jgi:hypothetical protein
MQMLDYMHRVYILTDSHNQSYNINTTFFNRVHHLIKKKVIEVTHWSMYPGFPLVGVWYESIWHESIMYIRVLFPLPPYDHFLVNIFEIWDINIRTFYNLI